MMPKWAGLLEQPKAAMAAAVWVAWATRWAARAAAVAEATPVELAAAAATVERVVMTTRAVVVVVSAVVDVVAAGVRGDVADIATGPLLLLPQAAQARQAVQ